MAQIGVLGAGTWGMALARMLSNSGHDVIVWSALAREVEEYAGSRRHPNLQRLLVKRRLQHGKLVLLHTSRSFCLGALQGVRAHELGEIPRLVHRGLLARAHFVQHDGDAPTCKLQCSLAPGKSRTNYDYWFVHAVSVACDGRRRRETKGQAPCLPMSFELASASPETEE